MKNVAIGILLIAAVVFGGLYLRQTRTASLARANAEVLNQKASELQANLEDQANRTKQLRDQVKEANADVIARSQEAGRLQATLKESQALQAQRAAAQAAGQTNPKPSNPLADMFNNPEMKEMIKNQQKAALGPMLDKNYAKLFSDLHLTPAQSSTLKELLLNKQLGATDMGMSMLSGDLDATKRAELVKQSKVASDAADAQIKAFLGDDSYSQFQTYEKSMAERMALSGFKDQLGSGTTALSGDQEQQLIKAMTQQRENFKFTTDLSDKSKFTGDFAAMFTEEKMTGFFQEMGQLNQQYLAQAQSILTPDQLAAFGKYLDNQQTMQKAGMQMAAKMFSPAKPAGN